MLHIIDENDIDTVPIDESELEAYLAWAELETESYLIFDIGE